MILIIIEKMFIFIERIINQKIDYNIGSVIGTHLNFLKYLLRMSYWLITNVHTCICTCTCTVPVFLISSYGAPLAQRASYLALHSSLFRPDDAVNYDYIITNSINSLLIGSRCIPNGARTNHC